MIRTPLRPLARILQARQAGENPDLIERENIRKRHHAMRDEWRLVAEQRLLLASMITVLVFSLVGVRMWAVASEPAAEPVARATSTQIHAARAGITDRKGRVLATNLVSHALYAQPPLMTDPVGSAQKLAEIFPDLDAKTLTRRFTGERKFLWLKRRISPEQMQAVHDIGDPGLQFGPREMRLYPNGKIASHVLGGTSFGREGVHAAELVGVAGVEKAFNAQLSDPAGDGPLTLSLDLTVQSVIEDVLAGGMRILNARGAAAVLMDVHSGEILAMASLPDFDPNTRPRPLAEGEASDSPLFNRAVQGVYELGSGFKIFTAAQALELGLVNPSTMMDTTSPMQWGRHRIRDFRNYGPELSVTDVIVKSSNVGTARLALQIGGARQKDFLGDLGFLDPTSVELIEAPGAAPLYPKKWSDIHTMTISYGHGISTSPLHLAVGYASLVNGGTRVTPTLLKQDIVVPGPRVVSERTSAAARAMLHAVVERGTASFAKVPGYAIGGKTGTADKPLTRGGGYYKDKVIATFSSVFPIDDPKYVLVVTLDEPSENSGDEPRRTAGWTAVPVSAEITRRIAPLLGLRPSVDYAFDPEITLATR
ncbi:peptidoglycan D,D-transpeptidase FtsI family protein [Tropicimonas sp. S265A]|uniref:peptidoglycan D,D-transpeptidase FtsI family protein n=1 Tax=Tropicimonas sp. S265A TaxID=3415134 RepID=UPI003C7DD8AC